MTPVLLLSLVALAALAAASAWWIRRTNLASGPAARRPLPVGPINPNCDLGVALMSTTEAARSASRPAEGGQTGVGAGKPGGTPAPRRQVRSGPTRRAFLRTSWLVGFMGFAGTFAGASIAFLWPNLRGGFGAEIDVGDEETILSFIADNQAPFPYPAGRMWVTTYDPALDPEGMFSDVVAEGARTMALYQKCVHLGCRVPWNDALGRFACPCHGSNYDLWGEYLLGPAPRGLDRFPLRVEGGRVLVDTAQIITGPPRGTNVYTA